MSPFHLAPPRLLVASRTVGLRRKARTGENVEVLDPLGVEMVNALLPLFSLGRAARFRTLQPRPEGDPWVRIVAADPVRVLIVGAGLAAAYGVDEHRHALGGMLARRITERTGRGVIIETRAVALMPARQALKVIGPIGAHTFDIVVFAGCYLESAIAVNSTLPLRLNAILEHLTATGPRHLRIVVAGFPAPTSDSPMDAALAKATARTNRRLHNATCRHPSATYAAMPDFHSVHDSRPFNHAYYAAAATAIIDSPVFRPVAPRPD